MSMNHSYESCKAEKPKNKSIKSSKHINLVGDRVNVDLKEIDDHQDQARSFMKEPEYLALRDSIDREGLLHPLILFKKSSKKLIGSDKYIVMSGHRRLRALRELGYKSTEALVHKTEIGAKCAAVSTNHYVEAIHPIDKGVELMSLWETGFFDKKEELSTMLNISGGMLSRYLSYNSIPVSLRAIIVKHDIRSKTFLRDVNKVCKVYISEGKKKNWSESEIESLIVEDVEFLLKPIIDKNEESNIKSKKVKLNVQITNLLYVENGISKIRFNALAKLDDEEKVGVIHSLKQMLFLVEDSL